LIAKAILAEWLCSKWLGFAQKCGTIERKLICCVETYFLWLYFFKLNYSKSLN